MALNFKPRWNIAARMVIAVAVISCLAIIFFSFMVADRLDKGLVQQKKAIERLGSDRLFQRLDLQASLIISEINHIKEETDEVGLRLSAAPKLRKALKNGNREKLSQLLNSMVKMTEIDSLLVVDKHSNFVAGHDARLIKEQVQTTLSSMSMLARARGVIQVYRRTNPNTYSGFIIGLETYLRKIGIETSHDQLTVAGIYPLFDETGEVLATLFAHRIIPSVEPSLFPFGENGGLEVRLLTGDQTLLSTHFGEQDPSKKKLERHKLSQAQLESSHISKCHLFYQSWRLCIYRSDAVFRKSLKPLVDFVRNENYSLVWWLTSLAFAVVTAAVIAIWLVSNKILRPLNRIAKVVHSVAKGNWLAHVPGKWRADEVGEIARAVVVLQQSMKDRERLQSDVDNINEARSHKIKLERELENTQLALRRRLFNLSDIAEQLEKRNKQLNSAAADAIGEVDESRLVASRASKARGDQNKDESSKGETSENIVVESIDRLGETLNTLYLRTGNVSDDVNQLLHESQGIDKIVKNLHMTVQNGSLGQSENMGDVNVDEIGVQKLIELKG